MGKVLEIHPDSPQPRAIAKAAQVIREGGVIVYPTDSSYALACHLGDKEAVERIRTIRALDDKHNLTLVCRDLSEVSTFAIVPNAVYRILKAYTPGPYTFLLKATKEVPRRLQHPKRKTIGLRIPDNKIAQALLEELGEPMMSTTLILPGEQWPMIDPLHMHERLGKRVDLIIDGGECGIETTTVVDLTVGYPELVREGKGDSIDFVE